MRITEDGFVWKTISAKAAEIRSIREMEPAWEKINQRKFALVRSGNKA